MRCGVGVATHMLEEMAAELLLLVDTCGERGSVALARGGQVIAEVTLPERAASAGLLGAVREVLAAGRAGLTDLDAVGVVRGPGSFTGVRVGLAVCKGLCEAARLRMAAVSRLEVLAHAAGLRNGFAVLRAGRAEVYVRELQGALRVPDRLLQVSALVEQVGEFDVVYTEEALLPLFQAVTANLRYVALSAGKSLGPVQHCLAAGGSDVVMTDADYVRDEEAIYARAQQGR